MLCPGGGGTNKAACLPTMIAVSPFRGSQTPKRTGQGTRDTSLTARGAWGKSGKLSWRGDACVILTRTVKMRPDRQENTRRHGQRHLVWRVMNVLKTPRWQVSGKQETRAGGSPMRCLSCPPQGASSTIPEAKPLNYTKATEYVSRTARTICITGC